MAKKIWNNPIDKNIDWGGDDNTGGLPVSGEMVQRFIKESLESKAGIFHYDTTNNRYLIFSDSENRDLYVADPTRTDLIIGSFDAPFNYSAEIFLTSKSYNAIALGATGNYIDFTFDVKNKQGASTGENVVVTYTVIRNATKQIIKENKKHGDAVHFNVDKYLGEGTNTVIVGIQGQSTLAATTVAITYQVVNLTIQDVLDISRVYNITKGDSTLEIPFTVSGYGTKTVEWYIDGELVEFDKSTDEVVDVTTTRTKYINIANLQQGNHHLEVRAFTVVNGENFYTDTLYRDFFIYTGANSDLMLGVALTIPAGEPIVGTNNVSIPNMIQYVPYTVRLASYSPLNTLNTEITIRLDDEVVGTINTNNSQEYTFEVIPSTDGDKVLYIETATTQYTIPVIVAPSLISIEEITNNLALDFNGRGKNNSSIDKDYWAQGDYIATFEGFEWNDKSGWFDGRLEMNAGTSLGINYAPLSGKPTNTGKTIEIEWSTKNVVNDDAIICDLRGDNGAGILITATKVSLTSVNGVTIETEYKSDENVRVAFVINKASNATNQHLSFIYCNGKISRGETWAITDSYTSDKEILFTSTSDAEISLKAIRIYDIALSSDEILNNYILYRDNIDEMLNVYERNDVYEDGTTTFSPDKMMSRLPVMIVTGDIPVLEETSDKNTQIVVDIDYYNMQDPSKSFRMVNAAMRPQGTSSMGYPKKNFRIYTRELEGTTLYDSNGKVVIDKLYSFKDGAQPVDCWCLKADYAESSGTHNTGIARLWNKALYDARVTVDLGEGNPHNIDRAAVLRTNAQTKALEANYPYDVRTTIDGFPILMFYRRNENDSPIFIGKYNFNNDKSTESVFGFTGIPNFDNSRMQCWEILNNGNSLALFTEADSFDTGWKDAFESRYPDTKTPNTSDLKAFCQWMSTVTPEAFVTEKWNHIDVYKVAAYWVYLMRHAGADQFVKNAMLTSEDGEKFYYILYDNDTINGLINTGDIRIKPTDDRQTVDASGSYVFAGHDSRMWNLLEADEEFNEIVAAVDNALYSAGISYINTIKIFDEDQSNKWVERVYNQDAEYKYIGPYREEGTNNLFMMQGSRDLHRRWWLSKRFSIFDAKYVSGTYKSDAVEIKCLNGTEAGQQFTITAGYPLDYGYGINNKPREKGVTLNIGDSYTFTTQEVVNVGDPIRIYGAPNISELDLSLMTSRLATLTVTNANSDTLGTKMKKLVVGNPNVANMELKEISGLKKLTFLEHLDIQGLKNITSLDLTSQPQLKELKAFGSSIASVSFAKGAPVEKLELPTSVTSLDLNQLTKLTTETLLFESGMNGISSISIKGCPKLSKDFAWVYNWYANKTTPNETSSLVMDNVDWKDVNAEQLAALTNLGNISLKGKVTVTDITLEQLNMLINAFGESAFDKNAELFINAPDAIFVTGRTELLEGESEDYACIVFGAEVESLTWSIYSGGNSSYTTIDAATGLLTTKEGSGARTLVIRVIARTSAGTKSTDTTVKVKERTYPASGTTTLSGSIKLNNAREVYKLDVTTPNVNGEYVVTWSLTGMDGYAEIESSSNTQCVIKKLQEATTVINGTLTADVKKKYNNSSIFSKTFAIELVNDTIAETDKGIVTALYNAGLCANSTYITKEEAALITDIDLQPGTSYSTSVFFPQRSRIKTFDGFQYFTSLTKVSTYLFYACSSLTSITIPSSVSVIELAAFASCSSITHVRGGESITDIMSSNFGYDKMQTFEIPTYCFVLVRLPKSLTPKGDSFSSYYLDGDSLSTSSPYYSKLVNKEYVTISPSSSYSYFKSESEREIVYATPFGTVANIILPEIVYRTVRIITNKPEATSFTLSYISTLTGEEKTKNIVAGEDTKLDIATGYAYTATPEYRYIDDDMLNPYTYTPYNGTALITINMKYVPRVDVFIQHIDGSLYTTDEWTSEGYSNEDANGVACISEPSCFVIAKTLATTSNTRWGGYNKTIEGIQALPAATVIWDFDGVNHTPKIIEQLSGYNDSYVTGAPAAEACANYTFPNGKKGYLPALGELKTANNNKDDVERAMTLIGGTSMGSWFYWSSSPSSSSSSWGLTWNTRVINSDLRGNSSDKRARAFLAFVPLSIISNRSEARFEVSYTNVAGVAKTTTLGVGTHYIGIKLGTEVTITPLSSYGNIALEAKTFTFTEETSEQVFNFVVTNGIFIQHVNNSLYTTDEWTSGGFSNEESNGVAIVTDETSFVISKENLAQKAMGGYSAGPAGIVVSNKKATAILDFKGASNTKNLVEQLEGYTDSKGTVGAPAAEACNAYIFPNGKKGYLPSLGELTTVLNNRQAVSDAITLVGGAALLGDYWASTGYSYSDGWLCSLNWSASYASSSKKYLHNVRAYTNL